MPATPRVEMTASLPIVFRMRSRRVNLLCDRTCRERDRPNRRGAPVRASFCLLFMLPIWSERNFRIILKWRFRWYRCDHLSE